jgi:hypothetical protein
MTRAIETPARRPKKPIVDRGASETKLYHRCRNPKCRVKLSAPAENPRKAFCCRGCYDGFYARRCLVCENDKPTDARADRKLCRRPKCRSAYRQNTAIFQFWGPDTGNNQLSSKSARKSGTKTGQFEPRTARWRRFSTGPALTLSQLRCAVVPDGPGCQWAGGSIERVEAANRRALDAYFDKLDSTAIDYCSVCRREDDLVDYKVGHQWVTTCREHRQTAAATNASAVPSGRAPCMPSVPIADNLSIPEFLRRAGGDL